MCILFFFHAFNLKFGFFRDYKLYLIPSLNAASTESYSAFLTSVFFICFQDSPIYIIMLLFLLLHRITFQLKKKFIFKKCTNMTIACLLNSDYQCGNPEPASVFRLCSGELLRL